MPTFDNWLENNRLNLVDASQRAVQAWTRINDKPRSLVLNRNGSNLGAQTVRLEFDDTVARETSGETGQSVVKDLIIFGVQGHPSVTDTDIKRGDRFAVGLTQYEVIDVNDELPGEIQARAKRTS